MKAQNSLPLKRGFALIATISVLLLLTLIAVAFLSLSAVTVSSSRIEWAQEEARANARLALMIAIGELQREMGPDQRVSATASILDGTPNTEKISRAEVSQPNWVGVWSTNWEEALSGETGGQKDAKKLTPWQRDGQAGGLQDRRYTENWDRERNVSTWLVSGNEGGRVRGLKANRDFKDAAKDGVEDVERENQLEIVGEGSVIDADDIVRVPAISINRDLRRPNGQIQPTATGRYGFWIGDESTKASLSVSDRHADENPTPLGESGYQRIFNAQDIETSLITGLGEVSPEDQERLVSTATIELLRGIDSSDLKNLYHDITANTRSVLANNRDGGLKKDLSLPIVENRSVRSLENGRLEYVGLNLGSDNTSEDADAQDDGDLLVGPPSPEIAALTGLDYDPMLRKIAPRFRILANWLNMARNENFSLTTDSIDFTGGQSDLKAKILNYGSPRTGRSNVWDRLLGNPGELRVGVAENSATADVFGPQFTQIDSPSLSPTVVEAGFYYNIATRQRSQGKWQLYTAMYPRVALWNPYNADMVLPPMLIQLFVNGNKDLDVQLSGDSVAPPIELGFGSRRGGGNGHLWFLLAGGKVNNGRVPPGVTIPPGQTLVFTPDHNNSKRQGNLRGNYSERGDTLNNLLTPFNAENSRNYLLDEIVYPGTDDELAPAQPLNFRETGASRAAGGDNFQFMLKDATGMSKALLPETQRMPMMVVGNISLQAGGSDELPVVWDKSNPVPIYRFQNNVAGRPLDGGAGGNTDPDVRTRDGFRMRWFNEHPSNTDATARFSDTDMFKLFQTAMIGNWNVRARYIIRNPWDNVTDEAPYFFGNYTRDEFDDAISWSQTNSVKTGGVYTGFPFGSPQSSFNSGPVVLFELPSANTGIPNLAHLRHVKLSELAWSPTYPIGNSLADPRCQPDGTIADLSEIPNNKNGWNVKTMGNNNSRNSGQGSDYWSRLHRELLMYQTEETHVVFDMSYETNFNLWDTFMIVNGNPIMNKRDNEIKRFADDPKNDPLPNGRLGLFQRSDLDTNVEEDLSDYFRAASRLSLEGGFNVNSTSVEAWKALLGSTLKVSVNDSDEIVFPRFLNPVERTAQNEGVSKNALAGNRELTDSEVEVLAEAIVAQVKKRAPFFGLSDFVNRRLVANDFELARAGAIETALETSGVNSSFNTGLLAISGRDTDIEGGTHNSIEDPTRLNHRLKPASQGWGLPGYLTQGDVLGVIGSALTSRGDTFKIRAYGDSRDVNGNILARAWCEATVQRTPEPMNPDDYKLNPEPVSGNAVDFGRRFRLVGFRWLDPAEV
ncbi:MAG: hypothetical protein ACN4GG_08180 [Akkermansiaceae bacterium]